MSPNIELLAEIASEAFMPLSYGGGINAIEQCEKIYFMQVSKKVIFNHASNYNQTVIKQTIEKFGSSSTVICIDAKKRLWGGYSSFTLNGKIDMGIHPKDLAKKMENLGVGEIIINSIDS